MRLPSPALVALEHGVWSGVDIETLGGLPAHQEGIALWEADEVQVGFSMVRQVDITFITSHLRGLEPEETLNVGQSRPACLSTDREAFSSGTLFVFWCPGTLTSHEDIFSDLAFSDIVC